ncbi:MAG: cyanoexosortase A [Cyanobacteria bacterium P01_D01_bin.123]
MKVRNPRLSIQSIDQVEFWLIGIGLGLMAMHLLLWWRLTADFERLTYSLICWAALLTLIWRKRDSVRLIGDVASSTVGAALIGWILLRSWWAYVYDGVLFEIAPFFSILGFGLIAVGARQLRFFWRELIIAVILAQPQHHIITFFHNAYNFSLLTAKISTSMLYYLGFEVTRQGVFILLPTGAIEVNEACSGVQAAWSLLQLTAIFLLVFAIRKGDRWLLPGIALAIAFVVNGFRIALLALIVAGGDKAAFTYWHHGDGSQLFGVISMVAFGFVCQWFLHRYETQPSVEDDSHSDNDSFFDGESDAMVADSSEATEVLHKS